MPRVQLAALALAATTLAVTGCGSSSKSESTATSASTATAAETTAPTTTPVTSTAVSPAPVKVATVHVATGKPLTQARWIAAGDAICQRLNAQLAANPVKGTKTFAIVLPQAAALERVEVAELAKLAPPSSKAKDWQTILTESLESAENTAALGKAAQTAQITLEDPLILATTKIRIKLQGIARRDGFKHCSSSAA